MQTILEVEEHDGRRKAKRLRACLVDDRTADTLVGNIKDNVAPSTPVQTDGWASYRRLHEEGFPHDTVNHSASEWVKRTPTGTVTTNTLEGSHAVIKRKARVLNSFQGVKGEKLNEKLQELVFRFNNRSADLFCIFLHFLALRYPVLPYDDLVERLEALNL